MIPIRRTTSPDVWIAEMFSAKAALSGRVIRRSRTWVAREVGQERFVTEVRRRGFHLLETADQWIVVCHSGEVRLHF